MIRNKAELVSVIESALIENSFLITKACRKLAHVHMSEHRTLRHRIIQLFDHFSPETQSHPKIQAIISEAGAKIYQFPKGR